MYIARQKSSGSSSRILKETFFKHRKGYYINKKIMGLLKALRNLGSYCLDFLKERRSMGEAYTFGSKDCSHC